MGPARLGAMAAVAASLVGFFAFLMMRLSTPAMAPLYTDLDFEDSIAIVRELESRSVPYGLRREGATVMVPERDVLRLRMELAGAGLPTGGGVGYEIFDRGDTLGATSFVQNVNHLRALEGELSRTIRSLDRISSARVHLVLPERQLFSRERREPTASIAVRTRGTVEPAQIRAIQHLVAAAVEGLAPGRVSVIDDSGRLLADGRGTDDPASAGAMDDRRRALERQMRAQVEEILASVVGQDRVRVQVAAELELNRVSQTSDIYDPEGRVMRSMQTREDNATSRAPGDAGATVANELPDAGLEEEGGAQDTSSRLEEVINYEISRTTRTEVTEAGGIRRLTVAVVVDANKRQDATGDVVYEPRSPEQLGRIAALVRSAIGFSEARGDTVEVANLRFAEAPPTVPLAEADPMIPIFSRGDILRLVELAVLALVGTLLVLFVARPLVRSILAPAAPTAGAGENAAPAQIAAPGEVPQIAGPAGAPPAHGSDAVQIAQIAGEVQASSIRRVGELVERNPAEAVNIIRTWIHEPA